MKKGFTLIELVVVIAIIAIMSTILIPQVSGYIKTSKSTVAVANCKSASRKALEYVAQNSGASEENTLTYVTSTISKDGEVSDLHISGPTIEFTYKYTANGSSIKVDYASGVCTLN